MSHRAWRLGGKSLLLIPTFYSMCFFFRGLHFLTPEVSVRHQRSQGQHLVVLVSQTWRCLYSEQECLVGLSQCVPDALEEQYLSPWIARITSRPANSQRYWLPVIPPAKTRLLVSEPLLLTSQPIFSGLLHSTSFSFCSVMAVWLVFLWAPHSAEWHHPLHTSLWGLWFYIVLAHWLN
jgi:hypothetical protein